VEPLSLYGRHSTLDRSEGAKGEEGEAPLGVPRKRESQPPNRRDTRATKHSDMADSLID